MCSAVHTTSTYQLDLAMTTVPLAVPLCRTLRQLTGHAGQWSVGHLSVSWLAYDDRCPKYAPPLAARWAGRAVE